MNDIRRLATWISALNLLQLHGWRVQITGMKKWAPEITPIRLKVGGGLTP